VFLDPVPQISRRLKGDAPAESKAYRYSRENYLGLTRSDKGRGAVSANQSVDAMKMGQNLAAGPGLGFTAEPEQAGITDLTQNVRNVADRTFVMNAANQWVDTRIANLKNPKKVVVNYLSDEYFKLLREKPQIGKFLALGEGVIVYFDGVVYEVKK